MRRAIAIALIGLFVSLLVLPAPVAAQDSQPTLPHQFYGTVKIRSSSGGTNVNAPVGTVVSAKVNDVEKGRITVATAGKYGGPTLAEGKLVVSDVAAGGSEIKFYINGYLADTPPGGWPGFDSEEIDELNLTAYVPAPRPGPGPPEAPPAPLLTLTVSLEGEESSYTMTEGCAILDTVSRTSADGNLTITIPDGTYCKDIEEDCLSFLTIDVDPSPPEPPEGTYLIGAYDFGPDGATFDPPITLTWSYDPEALPEWATEENLVIAYYDEVAGEWVYIPCEVDTENNIITAEVEKFTTFAIIAVPVPPPPPPAPAAFLVSSLTVQPAEVQPKEAVTITVSVANTGGTEGTYTVVLKIDEVKVAEKRVTIAAGDSQAVSFTVSKADAGSYSVVVDGLSGSFVVVAPPAVPPEEVVPPVVPPPVKPPINWPLIGGVIAGVVVVGLLIFFLVRRKRAY